jgi:hypothetical protein
MSNFQGNKMNDIDVVYTMWSNLHKTDGMEVGQVGFHKQVFTRNEIPILHLITFIWNKNLIHF